MTRLRREAGSRVLVVQRTRRVQRLRECVSIAYTLRSLTRARKLIRSLYASSSYTAALVLAHTTLSVIEEKTKGAHMRVWCAHGNAYAAVSTCMRACASV